MIDGIKNGRLIHGNSLKELKNCPDNVIDLIVTDPPYGLCFYGLEWDRNLPELDIWRKCLRVLKPGCARFMSECDRYPGSYYRPCNCVIEFFPQSVKLATISFNMATITMSYEKKCCNRNL